MHEIVDQVQRAPGQRRDARERLALPFLRSALLLHLHQRQDRALGCAHVVRDEAQRLFALAFGLTDARDVGQRGDRAGEVSFGGMDGGALQDEVAPGAVAQFEVCAPRRRSHDRPLAVQRLDDALPRGGIGDSLLEQVDGRAADAGRAHAQPLEIHDGGLVAESHAAVLVEDKRGVGHAVQAVGQEAPQVAHACQGPAQFADAAFERRAGPRSLCAGLVQHRRILALQAAQLVIHVAQRRLLAAPAP
ncbi:hypothetical protein D9M68_472370 [compost metagenome]